MPAEPVDPGPGAGTPSPYNEDDASPFQAEQAKPLVVVARRKGPTASRFDATGLTTMIGEDNFYGSVRDAVTACATRIGESEPRE